MRARKRKRLMVKRAQLSGKYNELDRLSSLAGSISLWDAGEMVRLAGLIASLDEKLRREQ